jgi:hypothetical protein
VKLVVIYRYPVPKEGDFYDEWPIQWRADSTEVQDPKQGNSSGYKMQAICRPARPPLCVR